MRKRFWLRVVVFPALFALINGAGIGFIYVLKALGVMNFQLEGLAWFAWAYPITIFFVLSIFSILKLRAEEKNSLEDFK
ncbi:MAG: hypothetical protein ACPGN3_04700 [Opitutales bacterium]